MSHCVPCWKVVPFLMFCYINSSSKSVTISTVLNLFIMLFENHRACNLVFYFFYVVLILSFYDKIFKLFSWHNLILVIIFLIIVDIIIP